MIRQRIISLLAVLLLAFAFPATVFADDGSGTSPGDPSQSNNLSTTADYSSCPYDTSQIHGTTSPSGAGASTYLFNKTTCLWENDYYTWDPVSKAYTPKYDTSYTYNASTGMWETHRWVWNTAKGEFDNVLIQVAPQYLSPSDVTVGPGPTPASIAAANASANNNNVPAVGPGSNNGISNNTANTLTLSANSNIMVTNNLTQLAISGDVAALQNTYAGNAQSGDATDMINILNMLQTSWDIQGAGDLMTFVANINGNVTGDLLLDPNAIGGPGSNSVNQSNTTNNLTVNSQNSGQINNNVDLTANSGNVDVSGNTQAGNATSGNATVIANLVNMIDSAVFAGKSFIGVININGDLNGDILLPPNFLDQLIASGAPSATITISKNSNTNVDVNANSGQTINNDVNLNAQSGSVDSSKNTTAGDATSGSANTKLTIFNLTNRQVIGANSLLVFVNVVGTWVGMIVDAPGANSAAFCGGQCSTSTNVNNNASLNDSSTQAINNNLDLNAKSGDVNANKNTQVGNAASGDANASANILNIENSSLNLNNWFGILFINVLGAWNGSFGINTAAGNAAAGGMGGGGSSSQPFKFVVPKTDGSASSINNAVASVIDQANQQSGQNPVAGAASSGGNGPTISHTVAKSSKWIIPLVSSLVGVALIGGEQITVMIRKQNFNGRFKFGLGQVAHSLRLLLL